ncbi:Poly(A) polymerase gamma, partial [Caligus rogercresseyi]
MSRRAQPFYTSDMCIFAELLHRAKVSAALSEADIHEIINSSQHRSQTSSHQLQRQGCQTGSRSGTPSPVTAGNGGNKESSYAAAVSIAQHHHVHHNNNPHHHAHPQHGGNGRIYAHHHHHIISSSNRPSTTTTTNTSSRPSHKHRGPSTRHPPTN